MTARYLAVQALLRVEAGGYANLVLDALLKKHPLEKEERAFASVIFYSVLEHRNTLDASLNPFLKKPVEKLDAPVRAILRSGLAQMRYLRTPPSAAVNEAVKLTRAFKVSSASGMVNAVLRRAGSFDVSTLVFQSPVERLSTLGSVSPAVARHFLAYYPADAEAILTAPPKAAAYTELRVNPLRGTVQQLVDVLSAEGVQARADEAVPGCVLAQFRGSPADSRAFGEGLFHVEGRPSQLAACAVQARPGDTVIDFCAAPGGKSLTIAQEMRNTGTLYSCDVSENRVSLIEKALQRGQITCARVLCNDASVPNPALPRADKILTDVPCSGLGILAKKPDIRYKGLEEMDALTALQAKILENAANSLKPGGRLVYSTCTLNPDENEHQIERFLKVHPDFSQKELEHLPQGMLQSAFGALSLPNRTGLDGFFICAMEKH